MARFTERFGKYGFRPEAMVPVYGLAECTVGLAIPPLGRRPIVDHVQREVFLKSGRAVPAAADDREPLRFVACGHPLPGHQVRIVDDAEREVPRSHHGAPGIPRPVRHLGVPAQPRGDAQADATATGSIRAILPTSPTATFIITSRAKDMIIRGGRNIYPYELEEAVGKLPGVRKGCVAIFGASDPAAGTERLVVVAETREKAAAALAALRSRINRLAVELVGTPTDDIVLAPPQTVLKTSSGKIRRAATRDLYLSGAIGAPGRGAWLQVARVTWMGFTPGVRRLARRARTLGFAARAYAAFAALAPLAWISPVMIPRRAWAYTRMLARALLRASGAAFSVQGLENLPRGSALRRGVEPRELSGRAAHPRRAARAIRLRRQERAAAQLAGAGAAAGAWGAVRRALRCGEERRGQRSSGPVREGWALPVRVPRRHPHAGRRG